MAEAWRRLQTHFERMQTCESWDEMEKKLRDMLTDSAFSGAMKESCAWKALARALQLPEKQKQEDAEKVNGLQNQLDERKLFTDALTRIFTRIDIILSDNWAFVYKQWCNQYFLLLGQGAYKIKITSLLKGLLYFERGHFKRTMHDMYKMLNTLSIILLPTSFLKELLPRSQEIPNKSHNLMQVKKPLYTMNYFPEEKLHQSADGLSALRRLQAVAQLTRRGLGSSV
ncbi:Testis-Expressed Protein 13D [Manis pentadactyla]|nr:Testis-Expressed Protein 13D [Manis pentadactyla]